MAQIKTNLTYGTTGTLPAVSAANLTSIPAANLTGTLPALNGSALTTLNASNVSSGTLNSARYSGGKILQAQNMNSSTAVSYNTNSSFVDTGITDSITPSATSSKILIVASIQFTCASSSDAITWKALRDSTSLGEQQDIRATGVAFASVYSFAYVDSPSSTSAITYKFQFRRTGGSGYIYVNTSGTSTSSMALLEIGA